MLYYAHMQIVQFYICHYASLEDRKQCLVTLYNYLITLNRYLVKGVIIMENAYADITNVWKTYTLKPFEQ